MLDTRARKYFEPILLSIAKFFVKYNISANSITLLAFIIGMISGVLVYFKLPILAVIFLWLSGLFDAVDGNVARLTNTQSKLGAQIDIVSDRLVELSIIWGLALNHNDSLYAMLLLVSSILISMTIFLTTGMISENKTKKSFYYQAGLMERTEGFILSTIMILFAKYLTIITFIYAGLIIITIIQRIYETYNINKGKI